MEGSPPRSTRSAAGREGRRGEYAEQAPVCRRLCAQPCSGGRAIMASRLGLPAGMGSSALPTSCTEQRGAQGSGYSGSEGGHHGRTCSCFKPSSPPAPCAMMAPCKIALQNQKHPSAIPTVARSPPCTLCRDRFDVKDLDSLSAMRQWQKMVRHAPCTHAPCGHHTTCAGTGSS